MLRKNLLVILIPIAAALGAVMLALSAKATPALFGLDLSIAAWMFALALFVLPYLLYRRRRARRRAEPHPIRASGAPLRR